MRNLRIYIFIRAMRNANPSVLNISILFGWKSGVSFASSSREFFSQQLSPEKRASLNILLWNKAPWKLIRFHQKQTACLSLKLNRGDETEAPLKPSKLLVNFSKASSRVYRENFPHKPIHWFLVRRENTPDWAACHDRHRFDRHEMRFRNASMVAWLAFA